MKFSTRVVEGRERNNYGHQNILRVLSVFEGILEG